MNPKTVYEILELLETYHKQRRRLYKQLAKSGTDERVSIVLRHLVELEEHATEVVRNEMNSLTSEHATYLTLGPTPALEIDHSTDCRCGPGATLEDTLACVFASDHQLDALIDRLEDCTAAPSVVHLARRLRDMEAIKERQVANFTRDA